MKTKKEFLLEQKQRILKQLYDTNVISIEEYKRSRPKLKVLEDMLAGSN